MNNLDFWNSAVDLIDEISASGHKTSIFSAEELLHSFLETYMDNCDPAVHFQEYVFLHFIKAVTDRIDSAGLVKFR